MKHCVLYRLAPGADPVEVQEKLMKTYRKLDGELDSALDGELPSPSDGPHPP